MAIVERSNFISRFGGRGRREREDVGKCATSTLKATSIGYNLYNFYFVGVRKSNIPTTSQNVLVIRNSISDTNQR